MAEKRKELLNEVYEKAVEGSEYIKAIEFVVDKKIDAILNAYYGHISEAEVENLKNILYEAVAVTEKEAFISGMRYGMRLAAESLLQFYD